MLSAKFLTPVVTAFKKSGQIDFEANQDIYDFLIDSGMDGLLVMGSAGEFYALSLEERKQMIDLAVSHVQSKTKVILGTGCMTVGESIELSQYADQVGTKDIILMSPYYFHLSEDSLYEYFGSIAAAVNCNVYLYNFPDRTGYDITPALTLRLLRNYPNIVGYKDTVSDMAHTRRLITSVKTEFPDFEIYSGFDENFTRNILSDGNGAIGALSNLYPELFSELVEETNSGNFAVVKKIQMMIDHLMKLYDITDCFIPIIKKAMSLRGISISDSSRTTLLQVSDEQTKRIMEIMDSVNLKQIIR